MVLLIASQLFGVSCRDNLSSGATETTMGEFRPGQAWQYKTRPGEEGSRVVVCRVDSDEKLGSIVHVLVDGVAIKSPGAPDGVARVVQHMPFSAEALRKSVVALDEPRRTLPSYEEGYATWRRGFDDGKAGVFSVSVAEGIDFLEQALRR